MAENEGSSEYKKKFLSDDVYIEHHDKQGKVTGKTEFKKDSITGESWEQHYDKHGKATAYTEIKKNFWGNLTRITTSGEKNSSAGWIGIFIIIAVIIYVVVQFVKFILLPSLFALVPIILLITAAALPTKRTLLAALAATAALYQWLDLENGWYGQVLINQQSFVAPWLWLILVAAIIILPTAIAIASAAVLERKWGRKNTLIAIAAGSFIVAGLSILFRTESISGLRNGAPTADPSEAAAVVPNEIDKNLKIEKGANKLQILDALKTYNNSDKINLVKDIRKWYYAVVDMERKGLSTDCRNTESQKKDRDGKFYEQKYQICQYPGEQTIVTMDNNGFEWGKITKLYFKQNKIYFSFVQEMSEAGLTELRVYYDSLGKVFQILESYKTYVGEDFKNKNNDEITDYSDLQNIAKGIYCGFIEAQAILNKTKGINCDMVNIPG